VQGDAGADEILSFPGSPRNPHGRPRWHVQDVLQDRYLVLVSADVHIDCQPGTLLCTLHSGPYCQCQQIFKAIDQAEPFGILAFDVWHPRAVSVEAAIKKGKSKNLKHVVLVGMCTMTGFVTVALLHTLNSSTVGGAMFGRLFLPNGFPRSIIADEGSEFKGALTDTVVEVNIAVKTVATKEHQGVLCERFNRFLEKVERIHGVKNSSFEEFYASALIATSYCHLCSCDPNT
jgi:hypothetical protein